MLDAFHAMNVVIQKDLHATEGEAALLRYTLQERTQLCTRISHLFQGTSPPIPPHSPQLTPSTVLASSLKLEYPLTTVLPSSNDARDRLLVKIFKYRQEDLANAEAQDGVVVAKDEDYEMLYAYILVTGQLAEEIKKVEREVEEMLGVMDEEMLKLQLVRWGDV